MTLEISPAAMGQLVSAISTNAPKGSGSTHRATVLRTDNDGTTWVSIPGGADETPLHGTLVECAPGDVVDVTIANGRATATANATSPAATGRTVGVVKETAETAQLTANDAAEAAASAIEDATLARTAAASAQASAQDAETAAGAASAAATTASNQAESAQTSAAQANGYALGALAGLSDVEKVVGTLNWIAEHGNYEPTEDVAVEAGKSYYTHDGDGYAPVQEPTDEGLFSYALTSDVTIDPEKTYYVRVVTYTYALTEDAEIDQSKTYYTYDGEQYTAVAEPDVSDIATYYERTEHVSYEAVAEPDVSDIATYYERAVNYYELSVDESVQNYIATHLALTSEGLNLTADNTMYRAMLAADGLRIIDPQGKVVGLHGESIQLGSTDGIYFEANENLLAFRTLSEPIAWFGRNSDGIWEMHIQNTYAEDMVRFGDYAFIKRANGNMSLKWLGGE